jgi:adenylyl-sulfate kinase
MNNKNARTIWLTGLSGSGKTTLAKALKKRLDEHGLHSIILDGDELRLGINKNLGFSQEDRFENIRRVAEIATLMMKNGIIPIVAIISPLRAMRSMAQEIIGVNHFIEVFVNTSLEICEQRDVKGLYQKARTGEIKLFTGISDPYEEPTKAFEIQSGKIDAATASNLLYEFILPQLK